MKVNEMLNQLGDKMTSFELTNLAGPVDIDLFKEMLRDEGLRLTFGGSYLIDLVYDHPTFACALAFKEKHAKDLKTVKVHSTLSRCLYRPNDKSLYLLFTVNGLSGDRLGHRMPVGIKVSFGSESDYDDPDVHLVPINRTKVTPDDIDLAGMIAFRTVEKSLFAVPDNAHKPKPR